jgi:hypothetical protein
MKTLSDAWNTTLGILYLVGSIFVGFWIYAQFSFGQMPLPMALRIFLILGVYVTAMISSIDFVRNKPHLALISLVVTLQMLWLACKS